MRLCGKGERGLGTGGQSVGCGGPDRLLGPFKAVSSKLKRLLLIDSDRDDAEEEISCHKRKTNYMFVARKAVESKVCYSFCGRSSNTS